MYQDLVWASGYNLITILVAVGVLQPWGIVLRPEWGALAMSASTVIVLVNALLLRRTEIITGQAAALVVRLVESHGMRYNRAH